MRGFMVGALLGAIVAVLVAPRRGEETRELIRARADVWQDQVMSKLEQARSDVESLRGELLTRLDEMRSQIGGTPPSRPQEGRGPAQTEGPAAM